MIRIDKWPGLVTNASPYALPPGATVEQINLQCIVPGQVTARPGMQTVVMANAPTTTKSIRRAFRYQHGASEHIVYQDGDGGIYSSQVAASAAAVYAPPTPPTIASVVVGVQSLQVMVNAPVASGAGPVTGYALQVSSDNQATWTAAGSAAVSSAATLTGLTAGVGYYVRASASNEYATSAYGPALGVFTPTAPINITVPDPPQSVSAVAGNAMATVRWSAPGNNGNSAITAYTVQSSKDRGLTWTLAGTTSGALVLDVTALLNNTDYIFRVSATNAAGVSVYSASSAAVTPNAGVTVPSAPFITSSSAPTSSTATFTWTAPTSNGGSPITGYIVGRRYIQIVGWTDETPTGLSHTFSGLGANLNYILRVAAVNANGTGDYAYVSVATPPETTASVPGSPRNFVVTIDLLGIAQASWDAPFSDGGAAITSYTVQSSLDGASWTTGNTTTLLSSQVGLPGGLPDFGKTCYFRVWATNSVGQGAYASATAVRPGAPGQAQNISVTYLATVFSITSTVSFDIPADTGGRALTNALVFFELNGQRTLVGLLSAPLTGRQSKVVSLPEGKNGTVIVQLANGVTTSEASYATSVPTRPVLLKTPRLLSVTPLGDVISQYGLQFVFTPAANEDPVIKSQLSQGILKWFGTYSLDGGLHYAPFDLAAGQAGNDLPDQYVGTYISPLFPTAAVGYIEDVIVEIAIGYPQLTNPLAIDDTRTRSYGVLASAQLAKGAP